MKPIALRVRRLVDSDTETVYSLIDNETARLTNLQTPFELLNAGLFVMAYDTYGAWYNGALVGAFEIKKGGELSYLVHKDYRNKGIATEMLKMAQSIYKRKYKSNTTLWCNIHKDNTASIAVASKLGFNVKSYG